VTIDELWPGDFVDAKVFLTSGPPEGGQVVISGRYKLRPSAKATVALAAPTVEKQALAPWTEAGEVGTPSAKYAGSGHARPKPNMKDSKCAAPGNGLP
jgi:hypothetical protein